MMMMMMMMMMIITWITVKCDFNTQLKVLVDFIGTIDRHLG